jgi:hypothetical protein
MKYIEILTYRKSMRFKKGQCVKRIDVTGKSDRSIDTIESGMNRNLNHDEYYTLSNDSEKALPTI